MSKAKNGTDPIDVENSIQEEYDEEYMDYVIPDGVTILRDYAFDCCDNLRSVSIPDSIMNVEEDAFYICPNLVYNQYDTGVYLGNSGNPYLVLIGANRSASSCVISDQTKVIADSAFKECSSLQSITIPDSVRSIGAEAFKGCSNLASLTIPDSVEHIGGSAFEGSRLQYNEYDNALYLGNSANPYLVLIKAVNTSIVSCDISDRTKVIAGGAFCFCGNLTNIVVPDGVKGIGDRAFKECSSLTNIVIPDSVTCIEDETFFLCSSLQSVVIPDGVTRIGWRAFLCCDSLTRVAVPDSIICIESRAFCGCSSLASINLPDGVNKVGWEAFFGCSSLKYNKLGKAVYLGNDTNPYLLLIKATKTSTVSDQTKVIADGAFFRGKLPFEYRERIV